MKIGPREQFILLIVGVAVVVIAVGALFAWPQFRKLSTLDAQIKTAQDQVAGAKTLLAQREAVKNRAAQTDAQWLRLSNLVPDSPDLPSVIIELQDAAFATDMQLTAVTPGPPAVPTQVTAPGQPVATTAKALTVPVQVTLLGTWSDTVDFLQRVLKLNRGVRIVQFQSQVSDTAAANPKLPVYSEATQVHTMARSPRAWASFTHSAPPPRPA